MCLGKEKVGRPRQESGADKLSGADEDDVDRTEQGRPFIHQPVRGRQSVHTHWGAAGSTVPALTELTV